ncbi:MAG: ABC transporter ATP-binding protein, partial [Halanaerobium sp. MSAO_Bac5]
FDEKDDLITALRKETRITVAEARNRLAAFLFTGEDVFKKVSQLSGGEKSRLRLLQLMSGNYNFLILDEPTNHLDLPSREVLEEALKEFSGTVLIVSHDRYFLDEVVDYIYELENSELKKYYGNYSYYSRKKEKINIESKEKEAETINQGRLDYEAQKKARNREMQRQNTLDETESLIEELETKLAEVESQLTKEKNLSDFEKLQELKKDYERINNRLEVLYEKWEKLLKN